MSRLPTQALRNDEVDWFVGCARFFAHHIHFKKMVGKKASPPYDRLMNYLHSHLADVSQGAGPDTSTH